MKTELADVYPFVKDGNVVLREKTVTLLKMSVKDFLALAEEVRRKHETTISG